MKLLLLGEHWSANLGDGVISECFRKVLDEHNIEYVCLDLSMKAEPSKDSTNEQVTRRIRKRKYALIYKYMASVYGNIKRLNKLKKEYRIMSWDYNAAVYVGGSLFKGYFARVQKEINAKLCKKNIPVFYNACGTGVLTDYEKKILKKALRNKSVKAITARDSVDYINKVLCPRVVASKSYDIALLCNKFYKFQEKRDVIGLGFISLDEDFNHNLTKLFKELIGIFEENQIQWEIFTNGNANDYQDAINLFQELQSNGLATGGNVAVCPQRPHELVGIISSYKKIISCRLHSLIIAYSLGIPAMAIKWSSKIDAFYADIMHEDWVFECAEHSEKIYNTMNSAEITQEDAERLLAFQNAIRKEVHGLVCGEVI